VEGGRGLLEDHRHIGPAHGAQLLGGDAEHVLAGDDHGPDRCAVSGSRPRMDRAVTVLPDPDSPTMASTSPGETDSETSLTACTSPPSVEKVTSRPSTSRMLPVAEAAESCVCLLMP